MDTITINGREYVRQLPEHGRIRGRRSRMNVNGVWYVRLDLVPSKRTGGMLVAEMVDQLRTLDFDDVIPGIREAISTTGSLLASRNGAHVGTLIDIARSARSARSGERVTLNGIPVTAIGTDGVTLLETS